MKNFAIAQPCCVLRCPETTGLHGCVYSFARRPGILTSPRTLRTFLPCPPPGVAFWSWFLSTYLIRAHGMVCATFHSSFHRLVCCPCTPTQRPPRWQPHLSCKF